MAVFVAAALGGCTTAQVYGSGQAWQRNACNRLADADERDRCLARTEVTYTQYQSERRATLSTP